MDSKQSMISRRSFISKILFGAAGIVGVAFIAGKITGTKRALPKLSKDSIFTPRDKDVQQG